MNTKAVYTVRENNQDYYFFTHYAGGCSSPFATARTLLRMHDALNNDPYIPAPMCAAALLPQLTGDLNYPGEADGWLLFRQFTDSEAAAYMDRNIHGDAIPVHITIDANRRTVAFEFNPLCRDISLPDIEIPVNADLWAKFFAYKYNTAHKNLTGWQAKEAMVREMMENHALTPRQYTVPTPGMEQSM